MRENEQKVLDWVNSIKEEHGLPTLAELPPDATKEEALESVSDHCPIAKAIAPCGTYEVEFRDGSDNPVTVDFPDFVVAFIRDHDRRVHPYYQKIGA